MSTNNFKFSTLRGEPVLAPCGRSGMRLRLSLCSSFLVLAIQACGDAPILDLKIVTPEGPDPLTGVDTVRVLVSNPASEHTIKVTDPKKISLELEVEVESAEGSITLEALTGKSLKARGETPPMLLRPEEQQMSLLVAKAGALSVLRPRLASPGSAMASVLLPARGVLLAGGLDSAGKALATATIYNYFDHQLESVKALPAPRAGAVAAYCGVSCAVVALGGDGKSLADTLLRYDGNSWAQFKDGLDAATRRQGAGIASLADGTYLVAGGAGPSGALDTFLQFKPGTASAGPSIKPLVARARAARLAPAMAAGTGSVVIAGGQIKGKPACEVFYLNSLGSESVTLPGDADLAGGTAAVTLDGGSVALVGGRDSAGKLLRDAWIVDPSTLKAIQVKGVLARGRADHRLIRIDTHLLVLGGVVDAGPADKVEVLDATTLKGLKETSMQAPRSSFAVHHLGVGGHRKVRTLLLAGGVDAKGTVNKLEVYQTSVLLK